MMSVVNGYLCTCSCDVAKAKRGVDPHPKADGDPGVTKPKAKDGMVRPDDPAVVFDGSLRAQGTGGPASLGSVQPAAAVDTQIQSQAINILL